MRVLRRFRIPLLFAWALSHGIWIGANWHVSAALATAFVAPDGQRSVVVDVPKFALDAGEQVALQGSSGSGKTTFLNLIAGILQADSGRVSVGGQNLSAFSESERDRVRAQNIGYIF